MKTRVILAFVALIVTLVLSIAAHAGGYPLLTTDATVATAEELQD